VKRADWADAVRAALVIAGVLGAADVVSMSTMLVMEHAASAEPSRPVTPSPRLYYGGADSAQFIDQPKQNRGRIACYDPWAFGEGAPLWEGDVPQARADGPGASIEAVTRTQNTFTIDVDAKEPARIRLNTTYDKGWRTDVGAVGDDKKQLVVDLPPGRHDVHLKYWPRTLTLGFVLTFLGIAATVAYFVRLARKRRQT